jgi:hypothetical protein
MSTITIVNEVRTTMAREMISWRHVFIIHLIERFDKQMFLC